MSIKYAMALFSLLLGFILGVGATALCGFTVVEIQAHKVASLTEANYLAQAACRDELNHKAHQKEH